MQNKNVSVFAIALLLSFVVLIALFVQGDSLIQNLGMSVNPHPIGEDYIGRSQNLIPLYCEALVMCFVVPLWLTMWFASKEVLEAKLIKITLLAYLSYLALAAFAVYFVPPLTVPPPLSADQTVHTSAQSALLMIAFPLTSLAILAFALVGGLVPYKVRKLQIRHKSK